MLIILGILLIIILLVIPMKEGFTQIQDLEQDRTNPLSAYQAPLSNPLPRGIPTIQSDSLRSMSKVAFNVPIDIPHGAGGTIPQAPLTQISPRMDDANSFLGLVEFCKITASTSISQGTSPFTNTAFSSNCGVCFPKAPAQCTLITGDTFTTPTGVVVYYHDKLSASNIQSSNNFNYPRAIPSLKAATCPGATSLNDDSRAPSLAINDTMYKEMTNRMNCIHSQSFATTVSNGECGQCTTNNDWSYIKSPPEGGMYNVEFSLYGSGNASVVVNNGTPIQVTLSSTVARVGLGVVIEGSPFQITVNPPPAATATVIQAQLYGAITSRSPNGAPYNLPIDYAITNDEHNNHSPPRMSGSIADTVSMQIIVPAHGQTSMVLNGTIPLTFIEPDDQIAYYDCTNGPYVTSSADAITILGSATPCADGLSTACKQSLLTGAKCTAEGSWWTSLPAAAGTTPLSVSNWLRTNANESNASYVGGCVAPAPPPAPDLSQTLSSAFSSRGRNILDFGLGAVILNENCMPPVEDSGWRYFLSVGEYDRAVDPEAFPAGVSYITVPEKLQVTIKSETLYDSDNKPYSLSYTIEPNNELNLCDPMWGSKAVEAITVEHIDDPHPPPPTDIGNFITDVVMELSDQYVIDPSSFRCSIM